MFICGGAFVGLEKIIDSRVSQHSIGFGSHLNTMTEIEKAELLNQVIPDDLVKFGLIPELIGRMPIAVSLNELSQDDLVKILTEPKNAITKQFMASFAMDDVDLIFAEESIAQIAEMSIQQKTGARGLRAIVEKMLLDIMFEIPSIKGKKKLTITKEMVQNKNCSGDTLQIVQKTA